MRFTEGDEKGGRRLHRSAPSPCRSADRAGGHSQERRHWQDFAGRIRAAGEHVPVLPSTLQAELRDYQMEGFAWLSRLAHWGAGACLADDMGLGKTVQAIAVMLEQAAAWAVPGGSADLSVPQLGVEMTRFAPTLNVHRLRQLPATGPRWWRGWARGDVLVASYGLLHQESAQLPDAPGRWSCLTRRRPSRTLKPSGHRQASDRCGGFRVALTGTPIENYLDELWSLFNFDQSRPAGIAGDAFQKRFADTDRGVDRGGNAREALRALIRPFILRRTKSAVLSELPPRTEQTVEVEQPEQERALLRGAAARGAGSASKRCPKMPPGSARSTSWRRSRGCAGPAAIPADRSPEASGMAGAKLAVFLDLVDELVRNRHKALVFSQFVGHSWKSSARRWTSAASRYQYLDGSTPARRARAAGHQPSRPARASCS